MKTATFLRFSLLIPFLVWGLVLLAFFIIADAMPETSGLDAFGEAATLTDYGILFLAFYIFGIFIWIFPYLLLALILFFWSFIGQARRMIQVFALTPIGMALLTVSAVTLIDLGYQGQLDQDFIGFTLLVIAVTLLWGYICVGIGYGIYKLLQRRGLIKDETPAPAISSVPEPL